MGGKSSDYQEVPIYLSRHANWYHCDLRVTRPRGYKTFFMLNSAEHKFILLINVKMPTIADGILTFISRINDWLQCPENYGIRVNGGTASGRTLIEKRMWIHPI